MPLRLRLKDPHAGVQGAPAYLKHWGQSLYLAWCHETGQVPIPYADFCERTLKLRRAWWCPKPHITE